MLIIFTGMKNNLIFSIPNSFSFSLPPYLPSVPNLGLPNPPLFFTLSSRLLLKIYIICWTLVKILITALHCPLDPTPSRLLSSPLSLLVPIQSLSLTVPQVPFHLPSNMSLFPTFSKTQLLTQRPTSEIIQFSSTVHLQILKACCLLPLSRLPLLQPFS